MRESATPSLISFDPATSIPRIARRPPRGDPRGTFIELKVGLGGPGRP